MTPSMRTSFKPVRFAGLHQVRAPSLWQGEAAYWAPLVFLFTGARREEVLSLWFNRYLRKVGIKTERLTVPSFRYTFKHYMRASGLPEDHHDAMTGHTTAEVARRYGSCEGYPVGPLAESMGRLRFGQLGLSRLSATARLA